MPVTTEQLDKAEERLLQVVDARLSSLKAWGVAAFLGGQTVAGLVGALVVKTGNTPAPVRGALSAVRGLF